jgi:hypothetical protein
MKVAEKTATIVNKTSVWVDQKGKEVLVHIKYIMTI